MTRFKPDDPEVKHFHERLNRMAKCGSDALADELDSLPKDELWNSMAHAFMSTRLIESAGAWDGEKPRPGEGDLHSSRVVAITPQSFKELTVDIVGLLNQIRRGRGEPPLKEGRVALMPDDDDLREVFDVVGQRFFDTTSNPVIAIGVGAHALNQFQGEGEMVRCYSIQTITPHSALRLDSRWLDGLDRYWTPGDPEPFPCGVCRKVERSSPEVANAAAVLNGYMSRVVKDALDT